MLILFPTPSLSRFCLILCSIFIIELEFKLYGIFSRYSWHLPRLGSSIVILSLSDQHPFSVLLRVYKSLFHHVLPSNVQPCNGFEFPHSSSTATSHFVHSSLVDQVYATVFNCVTKSNNQLKQLYSIVFKCIQHPNVFNSFHRIGHTWRVLRNFRKPLPLKRRFSTFHCRTSSFCYLPIFLH